MFERLVKKMLDYHANQLYLKLRGDPVSIAHWESQRDSYDIFKDHMAKSILEWDEKKIHEYAIKHALKNNPDGLFLEFGVYIGRSINYFAEVLSMENKIIYGFDAFKGLEEVWTGTTDPKKFNRNGRVPTNLKDNVELVVGWIDETLPKFIEEHNKPISFIHIDVDTYKPTKIALSLLKHMMAKNSIILFDELYGYPGWTEHEYKALKEVFDEDEFRYVVFGKERVVIEVL